MRTTFIFLLPLPALGGIKAQNIEKLLQQNATFVYMKLSVIIVSYNVKYYLEQCLDALTKALNGIESEVFVVDNHSDDDSVKMVSSLFPAVHLIVNSENRGFSKANNQAIKLSKGEYILLLNPDTLLEEDSLHKAMHFMDQHMDAGGLGVKMIDSQGKFLPESKRGLPTPWAAFCKMSLLSVLFPHSRWFNQYHLGFLPEDQIHQIDVLAGAFMLLRKSVLDTIGSLDEDFFMYGEDIDLSYRITQAGFHNYYFPVSRIIHYKGESTRKSSLNYVKIFYGSMLIFARKHFATKNKLLMALIILPGVYLRACSAYLHRLLKKLLHPIFKESQQITIDKTHIVNSEDMRLHPIPGDKYTILIVGSPEEGEKIKRLFNLQIINTVSPDAVISCKSQRRLERLIPKEVDIVIYSAKETTITMMIDIMEMTKDLSIRHYIADTDKKIIIRNGYVLDAN